MTHSGSYKHHFWAHHAHTKTGQEGCSAVQWHNHINSVAVWVITHYCKCIEPVAQWHITRLQDRPQLDTFHRPTHTNNIRYRMDTALQHNTGKQNRVWTVYVPTRNLDASVNPYSCRTSAVRKASSRDLPLWTLNTSLISLSLLHSWLVIRSACRSLARTGGKRREGTGRTITH